jgi:hypothetical protein
MPLVLPARLLARYCWRGCGGGLLTSVSLVPLARLVVVRITVLPAVLPAVTSVVRCGYAAGSGWRGRR